MKTVSEKQEKQEKQIDFQEKGVEGVIRRKAPELYEYLKTVSSQTGESIIDLLINYTNALLQAQRYSSIITEADLKKVTPESLYSSIKLVMWLDEMYSRRRLTDHLGQLLQTLETMIRIQQMIYYPQSSSQTSQAPLPPPPPINWQQKLSQLVEAITEGIRLFTRLSQSSPQTLPPSQTSSQGSS